MKKLIYKIFFQKSENLKKSLAEALNNLEKTKRELDETKKAMEVEIKKRISGLGCSTEILENKIKERTIELEQKTIEAKESKIALLNMLEDVEEEEKKVREEKNKTLAVIAHLTDGLMVFDGQGHLLLINPLVEKLFQIKNIEAINKTLDELALFNDFCKLLFNIVGKEIKMVFRQEIIFKEFVIEVSSVRIIFDKNKTGSLVILHDITREKEIEKIKSEFISIAAHQLRTPLSAIKWVIKMVLDGDAGKLTKEQHELLNKGYLSNERVIKLVNGLLDVSRIEEGKFGFNLEIKNNLIKKEDIMPEEKSNQTCDKCGSPMIIKTGRYGKFLACSGFPDCKNIKSLDGEGGANNKKEIPEELKEKYKDEVCDKCGAPMAVKSGRFGNFLGCSNYPKCKNIKNLAGGNPAASNTGVKCPVCGVGEIVQKQSRKGVFYACNQYPTCKTAFWGKPTGDKCPECNSLLIEDPKKGETRCSKKGCEYKK